VLFSSGGAADARGRIVREPESSWRCSTWAEWRVDCEEAFEVEPGRVSVTNRFRGVGQRSAAPVEREVSVVFGVSAGRVRQAHMYLSRADALESVGLN